MKKTEDAQEYFPKGLFSLAHTDLLLLIYYKISTTLYFCRTPESTKMIKHFPNKIIL